MKSVLLSIQPKWCELIASGKKTIEVRKTRPKLKTPFKCYIYCTNWKDNTYWKSHYKDKLGKVIGEFVCDEITGGFWITPFADYLHKQSCLSYREVWDYSNGKPIFSWHISDLVIYDKPRELREFSSGSSRLEFSNTKDGFPREWSGMKRPPQSWCYVESKKG